MGEAKFRVVYQASWYNGLQDIQVPAGWIVEVKDRSWWRGEYWRAYQNAGRYHCIFASEKAAIDWLQKHLNPAPPATFDAHGNPTIPAAD